MVRPLAQLAALLFTLSAGCSSPGNSPTTTTGPVEPRGGQAYSGATSSETDGLGMAPDAMVGDMNGQQLALSSLWSGRGAYVVFYRGDW